MNVYELYLREPINKPYSGGEAGRRIACEIAVTPVERWNTQNIKQCLADGYSKVLVCTDYKKNFYQIEPVLERELERELLRKVQVLTLLEAMQLFDIRTQQEKADKTIFGGETMMLGYRVRVYYANISEEERERKHAALCKLMLDFALKKLKRQ